MVLFHSLQERLDIITDFPVEQKEVQSTTQPSCFNFFNVNLIQGQGQKIILL